MTNDILNELNITRANLLDTVMAFPDKDFNKSSSPDTWSAAQVSDHIYKFVSGALEQLQTPVIPTTRHPHEKEETLRNIFLDFSVKFESPEFVLPGKTPLTKTEIYQKLEATFDSIGEVIKNEDITPTTTGFELPGLGPFTRAEWIWFVIYHTQRHTRQIKNLQKDIATNRNSLSNKSV